MGAFSSKPSQRCLASFPEKIVLVKMPLGATSALSSTLQVLEELEFSLVLVLEVPAFLVGLEQFLGLEASQVVSVPSQEGLSLSEPPGKYLTLCGCLSRGRDSSCCCEGGC